MRPVNLLFTDILLRWCLNPSQNLTDFNFRIEALRRILRRFPYWATGHLLLGELALKAEQVDLAYSSALAVQQLSSRYTTATTVLLAKCYLRRRDFTKAKAAFEIALADNALQGHTLFTALEDFAGVLMALGEFTTAQSTLEKIPEKDRTANVTLAYIYVTKKSNEALAKAS